MNEMQAAADRAHEELAETDLAEMTAEQLIAWVKANYRSAGYKRLIRPLLKRVA